MTGYRQCVGLLVAAVLASTCWLTTSAALELTETRDRSTGCRLSLSLWRPDLEVNWSGACPNGAADGPGKLTYSRNGISVMTQEIDPSRGVTMRAGTKVPTPAVEAAVQSITITLCRRTAPGQQQSNTFDPQRKVRVDVSDTIDLAHGVVLKRLGEIAEQKVWKDCPARSGYGYGDIERGAILMEVFQRDTMVARAQSCEYEQGFRSARECGGESLAFNQLLKAAEQAFQTETRRRELIAREQADRQRVAAAAAAEARKEAEQRARQEKKDASLAKYRDFMQRSGADGAPPIAAMKANPYAFEGRVVVLRAKFNKMLDRSTASFDAGLTSPITVYGTPTTAFVMPRDAILAVKVLGRSDETIPVIGAVVDHLKVRYVDAIVCQEKDCDDVLYWTRAK